MCILSFNLTSFFISQSGLRTRAFYIFIHSVSSFSISHFKHFIFCRLDKLEKKENDTPVDDTTAVKQEGEANDEEGEAEEFEEELDMDTDYMMSYFDDGEDYMDENNDADQEPYF